MNSTTEQLSSVDAIRSFIFALWEGGGNVPPTLAVVERLVRAGHSVRVMSDRCNEREVLATGAKFVPWTTAPSRGDKSIDTDILRDWETSNPPQIIARLRDRLFFGPAEFYARDLLSELKRENAHCVVTSDLLFGPMLAAESASVPCVALAANIYLYPRKGVPPFGPGFLPGTNILHRLRDFALNQISLNIFGKATASYNAARATFGLPPLSHPFEQLKSLRGVLLLTSAQFDFASTEHDPRIVYAGPELGDPSWSGEWESPFDANDARPLVLVGLSSTFQNQGEPLRQISSALSQLEVRAVLTTGPSISPRDIPAGDNVFVCATAPHSKILREASAMVTHCGHGSVIRGLAAGVPLLCMPMGRDQNDNAARVVAKKAGIRIPPFALAAEIRSEIQKLLTDPEYRRNAETLGKVLRRDFENSVAVEKLVSWSGGRIPSLEHSESRAGEQSAQQSAGRRTQTFTASIASEALREA